MSDYPFNPFMDDYSLKENQHKIAEAIYNDYSVLKFGAFGEKYLYAVCDYDVRKYNSLRRRPDFRQFIADKDKHYRRLMSILMVKSESSRDSVVDYKTKYPHMWDFITDRMRRKSEPWIDAQILYDVKRALIRFDDIVRVYVYEGRAFMDENAAYKPKEKTEVARQCALQLRSFDFLVGMIQQQSQCRTSVFRKMIPRSTCKQNEPFHFTVTAVLPNDRCNSAISATL